jgi:hypothetical protein
MQEFSLCGKAKVQLADVGLKLTETDPLTNAK